MRVINGQLFNIDKSRPNNFIYQCIGSSFSFHILLLCLCKYIRQIYYSLLEKTLAEEM